MDELHGSVQDDVAEVTTVTADDEDSDPSTLLLDCIVDNSNIWYVFPPLFTRTRRRTTGSRSERARNLEADDVDIGGCWRTISSTSSSTARTSMAAVDEGGLSTSIGLLLNAQKSMIIIASQSRSKSLRTSSKPLLPTTTEREWKERTRSDRTGCEQEEEEEVHDSNIVLPTQRKGERYVTVRIDFRGGSSLVSYVEWAGQGRCKARAKGCGCCFPGRACTSPM